VDRNPVDTARAAAAELEAAGTPRPPGARVRARQKQLAKFGLRGRPRPPTWLSVDRAAELYSLPVEKVLKECTPDTAGREDGSWYEDFDGTWYIKRVRAARIAGAADGGLGEVAPRRGKRRRDDSGD
jgi:hypothetical protein